MPVKLIAIATGFATNPIAYEVSGVINNGAPIINAYINFFLNNFCILTKDLKTHLKAIEGN